MMHRRLTRLPVGPVRPWFYIQFGASNRYNCFWFFGARGTSAKRPCHAFSRLTTTPHWSGVTQGLVCPFMASSMCLQSARVYQVLVRLPAPTTPLLHTNTTHGSLTLVRSLLIWRDPLAGPGFQPLPTHRARSCACAHQSGDYENSYNFLRRVTSHSP